MSADEPGQPPNNGESPPEDTFALVGHAIRAELIQVLGEDELSLSELRSRLDIDVKPSQLHYHIQQLVGHFVEKADDTYRLNSVGHRLEWTLRAGALDRRDEHLTIATGVNCYYCGGSVVATFDSGSVRLTCHACENVYMKDYYVLPIDAFEDETEAFAHFSQYMVCRILSIGRGVCQSCGNCLTTECMLIPASQSRKAGFDLSCKSCGAWWWLSVGMVLLADTGLVGFCYENGVDILSTPYWELEFAATDKHVTVRSTDPWEVALEVTFDDDTLELVVDGDLNVIERNRREATPTEGTASERTTGGAEATPSKSAQGDTIGVPDVTTCLESLRRHRWPNGVTCPYCDSTDTIKEGTTSKDTQRYRCHTCDSIFNDLTGTIFAGHRFPLPEMFYIINEMEDKTPKQIARALHRSYDSVLDFVHEVEEGREEDSDIDVIEVCKMTYCQ